MPYSQRILFVFSAQHDCRLAQCMASSLKAQVQEQQITDRANNHISHSDDNNFVINMCDLHNTMELW